MSPQDQVQSLCCYLLLCLILFRVQEQSHTSYHLGRPETTAQAVCSTREPESPGGEVGAGEACHKQNTEGETEGFRNQGLLKQVSRGIAKLAAEISEYFGPSIYKYTELQIRRVFLFLKCPFLD